MPLKTVVMLAATVTPLLPGAQRTKVIFYNVGPNNCWITHDNVDPGLGERSFLLIAWPVGSANFLVIDDEAEASMAWYAYDALNATAVSVYYAVKGTDVPRPVRIVKE